MLAELVIIHVFNVVKKQNMIAQFVCLHVSFKVIILAKNVFVNMDIMIFLIKKNVAYVILFVKVVLQLL